MKVFLVYDIDTGCYRSHSGWAKLDNAKIYGKIGSAKSAMRLFQSKKLILVEAELIIDERKMTKDIVGHATRE